jgi:hypothetical protein
MVFKKHLIVEGIFDKLFFDILLSSLTINDVDVKTPNKNGIAYNGKGNAIDLFASSLLNIYSGSVERLALIIDSDFSDISSQGFRNTLNVIIDKARSKGFDIKTLPTNYKNGILLKSDSCGFDVALWIMPNNKSDGYIEYLLFDALNEVKSNITSEATSIIAKTKVKEYPSHHEMKARLAIAMAMLENPGRNISHLIDKNILDYKNNPSLKNIITFLSTYFK